MRKNSTNGSAQSLAQVADLLVRSSTSIVKHADNEEELRIEFEKVLTPIRENMGIQGKPRYERFGTKQEAVVYRGRPDAAHGSLIIEYEPPNAFSSSRATLYAQEQLEGYLKAAAQQRGERKAEALRRLVGVGFDGSSIFFVQYSGNGHRNKDQKENGFVRLGPYTFNQASARTFLTHLRALSRLPLTADNLARKFGPESDLARKAIAAFAQALEHYGETKVRVFFAEWKRLFGIVYGEQFAAHQKEEAEKLASMYGVTKETDFQELLFSVHTYFALLMKLIAAELLNLRDGSYATSFSVRLAHAEGSAQLKEHLSEIEDGGTYSKRGVQNFLEGDFFHWYLNAFSPAVRDAIKDIAAALSDFEPATTSVNPAATRDLLKHLYQYLVPSEVRHNLGEYYTPDWLAELVLDEVGYDGNTLKRVLDPACGSGTFLVLAIQRARAYGLAQNEPPLETVKRIVANIWGLDLNPLAVIAARTNYLFALGDLVYDLPSFEIPIYLADSVLWPKQTGQGELNFAGGAHALVRTSVRDFHVPHIWVKDDGLHMRRAAPLVEEMAKQNYVVSEAMKRLSKEGLVFPPHEKIVETFYSEVLELEQQGKNGIWARFLKNAFAPMAAGKFDYVVGNPPWIRWGYLSQDYRAATLSLWQNYGLFSLRGHAARLGGGEKDFSMLFTYAAMDYYVSNQGKLGFLITQEVFKSKGAGEGFRRFRLGEGMPFKVLKAHDLVTVQPFEGAANKTAMLVAKKGEETSYPLPYTVWSRKRGVGRVPGDVMLENAQTFLTKRRQSAQPIGKPTGSWQTLTEGQGSLKELEGRNPYQARLGARVEPYGVFWLEIKQVRANGNLVVRNLATRGKRKDIKQVEEVIEPDLVFPLLAGGDIQRWRAEPESYVVMPQDPKTSEPYPEKMMKEKWPRTYGYLLNFRDKLLERGSRTVRELAERTAFYAMYGIGEYTTAPWKVIWKRMANDLVAAVISSHKTTFGHKTVIPSDTTSLIAADGEDEAHYLCAILNTEPVREFIKSFSSGGRGFGAPSVMEHVGIPKFEPKNPLHQKLTQVSKKCHQLKLDGKEGEIEKLEKENDEVVKRLFGIG